jgi:hypothetical protein
MSTFLLLLLQELQSHRKLVLVRVNECVLPKKDLNCVFS